jgi:hypothetical protein
LVEVLIATLILTMLVYLATLSYSIFLRVWSERRFSDVQATDGYRAHLLLRSAIESTYDYYVLVSSTQTAGGHCPYFKGTAETIEFVTLSSVFRHGQSAAARLRLDERSPASQDGFRSLVYEEALLDGTYLNRLSDQPEYSHILTVDPKVRTIRLRYLTEVPTATIPGQPASKTAVEWRDTFNAQGASGLPSVIELAITHEDGDLLLLFPVRAFNHSKRLLFHEPRETTL